MISNQSVVTFMSERTKYMTGKSHVIANTCSAIVIVGVIDFLEYHYHALEADSVNKFGKMIHTYFIDDGQIPLFILIVGGLLLYYLGTLLPDIDSKGSLLGRFFHLPIEHRTWTHAIWIPILLLMLSYSYRLLIYLALGYVLHLFWDNLSTCGVCFFYPFTKYKTYGSGAKVKKKHIVRFYKTGKTSEYVLLGVLITITCLIIIFECFTHLLSNGLFSHTFL